MARKRVWLSFDLGLTADFDRFYAWLDSLDAEDCAGSLTTFWYSGTRDELLSEIQTLVGTNKRARVYVISKNEDGRKVGWWAKGKRKKGPWEGYYAGASDVEDNE
ncbi:MAG: hypothetical protein ACYCYO_08395 [Bacilli bacterium]